MRSMIRILVVEDNKIVRSSIVMLIGQERDFLIVGEAEDGQAALELLQTGLEVDVVLSDLNMPRMNGIELTEKISAFEVNIKVIILTMHDKETFATRAFNAGARGYLLKSGDMDALCKGIVKVHSGEKVIGDGVYLST